MGAGESTAKDNAAQHVTAKPANTARR
jgi:hypothetical protein